MANHLIVTYTGGEVETIVLRPIGMVAAERQFGGQVSKDHAIEGTLYAGWFIKGKPGDFDDWLATIEDVDETEGEPTRPLAPEPSPEESQT